VKIFNDFTVESNADSSAVVIGSFDGVHIGHQELIRKAVDYADAQRNAGLIAESVVILMPKLSKRVREHAYSSQLHASEFLLTVQERIDIMQRLSVDRVIVVENVEYRNVDYRDFVNDYLLDRLKMRKIFLTKYSKMGRGARGNYKTLTKMVENETAPKFEVEKVDFQMLGDEIISSTLIKKLLTAGKILDANTALGRKHFVKGLIVEGKKLGKKLGFPTANFANIQEYLPKDGVYRGVFRVLDSTHALYNIPKPAVASLGTNYTFSAKSQTFEVHVIGETGLELYGTNCMFEFEKFTREMRKFASKDDLIAQLNIDVL
jgi:riboflavin kinase/FMN adenylyltransferase